MEHFNIEETELWAYISKTADDKTIHKVEEWMNSSNFDEALFNKQTKIFKNSYHENVDVVKAKSRFFEAIKPKKKAVWKEALKYTAILVVFISGFYGYQTITSNSNKITIQTAFGEQKNIQLPDGSTVRLNASTTLSYTKENPRKLTLEGEAFFEVAKDKIRPFTVTTQDAITVKALGTSFNVKSYKNSPVLETKLITGKVEVASDNQFNNKVLMNPKDKFVFYKKSKRLVKSKMDYNESEIAWKEGRIQFDNQTFKSIAIDLKSQYDIQIQFKNEAIANSKFTGSFDNKTSIDEIFEILKITQDFKYKLNTDNNEWEIE